MNNCDGSLHFMLLFLDTQSLFRLSSCSRKWNEMVHSDYALQQHWWHVLKNRKFKHPRPYLEDIITFNFRKNIKSISNFNFLFRHHKHQKTLPAIEKKKHIANHEKGLLQRKLKLLESYTEQEDSILNDYNSFTKHYIYLMELAEERYKRKMKALKKWFQIENYVLSNRIDACKRILSLNVSSHKMHFHKWIEETVEQQQKKYSLKRQAKITRLQKLLKL